MIRYKLCEHYVCAWSRESEVRMDFGSVNRAGGREKTKMMNSNSAIYGDGIGFIDESFMPSLAALRRTEVLRVELPNQLERCASTWREDPDTAGLRLPMRLTVCSYS